MFGEQKKKLIIVVDDKTKSYGELLSGLVTLKDDKDGTVVGIEDGTVEAVVWTENVYQNNQPQISSTNKVVFIGKNSVSSPIATNLFYDDALKQYGINMGSLGNKAVIYSESSALSNKDKYESFLNYFTDVVGSSSISLINGQNTNKVNIVETDDINRKKDDVSDNVNKFVAKGIKGLNKGLAGIQKVANQQMSNISEDSVDEFKPITISEQTSNKASGFLSNAVKAAMSTNVAESISFKIMSATSIKEILDQQYRCAIVDFYLNHLAAFME